MEALLKDYRVLFFCGVWQREQCQVVCAVCEIIPVFHGFFCSGFKTENEVNTVSQIKRVIYSSGSKW